MRLLGASVVIQHGGLFQIFNFSTLFFLLENFKSYSENALFNSLVCKRCFIIYVTLQALPTYNMALKAYNITFH